MAREIIPETSTTLLRDVADSGHARWSVFYSRYQPMMQAYLRERFPSVDADDIIQDTFAALARILPDYRYDPEGKGAFHNFLTGVLRNKALCALDRSNRAKTLEERMGMALEVEGRSVREQSYGEWRQAVFEIALQQLLADDSVQERTKEAFVRTAINRESIEKVAESLGVDRHAVEGMRARTLERLRGLVENLKRIC